MSTLGERLRKLRNEKGLLQKDIAKFLGMTPNAYQKYELCTREPNIETINKLCNYYNVPTDYLLGNGLFAKYDQVIKHRDIIEDAVFNNADFMDTDKVYVPINDTTNSEPKTINEIVHSTSNIKFVQMLSALVLKIDIDETSEPPTMIIYYFN